MCCIGPSLHAVAPTHPHDSLFAGHMKASPYFAKNKIVLSTCQTYIGVCVFSSTAWCLQLRHLTLWNVHTWVPSSGPEATADGPGEWSRAQRRHKAVCPAEPGSEADHGRNPKWTWSWKKFETAMKNDSVHGTTVNIDGLMVSLEPGN